MNIQKPHNILILLVFALLIFPNKNLAQTINLGTAANFVLFTSSGAVGNTGHSTINGNIGTNSGAVTGFDTSNMNGSIILPGSVTQQAATDLLSAYNQLMVPLPTTTRTVAFGTEVITPGIHVVSAAGTLAGTLTLDGRNLANAIFIFRIDGAFSTGAGSIVQLVNGASACNIFWVAKGAISLGASTVMKGNLIAYNAANALGVDCSLEGRMFSTSGAIATNVDTAILPLTSCWVGESSTNWNAAANWASGVIPTATLNAVIPANPRYVPILDSGIGTVKNIIIKNGGSLTVTGGKLQIAGDIFNSGIFNASAGTIEMNGSSAQTIPANAFLSKNIQNLVVSNNVTLAGAQNLTGTLSFGNSKDSLFTGDSLTLKSTALGTARVADITHANGNLLTGNAIKGKITVERYISAKRAWRLLATPIASTNAPTINAAWQEGVGGDATSNPNLGYGTHITGGVAADGFDQGTSSIPSLKIYNNITNSLVGLPTGSGTNIPITNYPAYFLFVRGDRSTQLLQGNTAVLSPTTLRMTGQINTGNIPININASNTTLVGNPYASAVDFNTLTKVNVNDLFYVWNPLINGSKGIGGYVTVSGDGNNNYSIAPAPSTVTQYIQSGEAFFVQSNGATGTLTFKESDKSAAGSGFIFKPMTGNKSELRLNLFTVVPSGTDFLSDGVLTTYNSNYSNEIDNMDAKKFYNIGENICIGREGKDYVIERRKTIETSDTTFLNLYKLKKQTYKLQFIADGMDSIGLHAVLQDKYLGPSKDTTISMGGTTNVNFTINADTASYAANRFSIVFKQDMVVLPVIFSLVKAEKVLKDIIVEWEVENELKIKNYEVEISYDGIVFTKAFSFYAQANNGTSQTYKWADKYVADGMRYYRIKSIDINGKYSYSLIVNVTVNKGVNEKNIVVFGNILKDNQMALRLNNIDKGSYYLKLFSMDGNIIKQFAIEYPGGNSTKNFIINNHFPSGKYEIILSGKNVNYKTSLIKE